MENKFQKLLIGTIILVALCNIILLWLLDGKGKKKHYHDEFVVIPLVPKHDDFSSGTHQSETLALPDIKANLDAAIKPQQTPKVEVLKLLPLSKPDVAIIDPK